MPSTFAQFKTQALKREGVKAAYDAQEHEFKGLDQFLRARAEAEMTQADVAAKMKTTQSVVARLESAVNMLGQSSQKIQSNVRAYVPSLSSLQRYAQAVGCRLELKLVRAV
jgi:transcriptional regulator with XRE-family HTH domain